MTAFEKGGYIFLLRLTLICPVIEYDTCLNYCKVMKKKAMYKSKNKQQAHVCSEESQATVPCVITMSCLNSWHGLIMRLTRGLTAKIRSRFLTKKRSPRAPATAMRAALAVELKSSRSYL